MKTENSEDPSGTLSPGFSGQDIELNSLASPSGQAAEALDVEASPVPEQVPAVELTAEDSLASTPGETTRADSLTGVLRRVVGSLAGVLIRAPVADRPAAVIHLSRGDGMAVVQAKLRAVSQGKAVLVVPGGTRLFRGEVDFALLRRWVAGQGLAVALVSHDPRVRTLARRHGFPVSDFVGRAQSKARAMARQRAGGRRPTSGMSRRLPASPRARGGWEEWLLLLVLILGAAVVGAGGALLVYPQATITVVPQGGTLEQQVQLTADPSIELVDEETMEIPARVIQTEIKGQAQVSTLAYEDAPDAKATGRAIFINRTNGPIEVAEGTVVATSAGTTIKFATVEKATLAPGLSSVASAGIEALDPGPSGNVGPFLINRVGDAALALRVRVTNEQATEGGSVKQVGVVTAADKVRLRTMLLQQLNQEAHARLEVELSPEEFLPIESVSVVVLDETYDHLLGEATDFLGMTMRVQAQGVVFDLAQARGIARTVLERAVPDGRALQRESFYAEVVQAAAVVPDPNEEQSPSVQLVMKARGWTEAVIIPGRVIRLAQGRAIPDAVAELQARLPLREPPLLSVEPEWWDRVPWLPFRIRVIVASERT